MSVGHHAKTFMYCFRMDDTSSFTKVLTLTILMGWDRSKPSNVKVSLTSNARFPFEYASSMMDNCYFGGPTSFASTQPLYFNAILM